MLKTINIVVRLMPGGKEVSLNLPVFTSGKEIVYKFINDGLVPRFKNVEGDLWAYELVSKSTNTLLGDDKTLYEAEICNGDTLLLVPKVGSG